MNTKTKKWTVTPYIRLVAQTILNFHFCRKTCCLKIFKQFLKLYDNQFSFLWIVNVKMKENRNYP